MEGRWTIRKWLGGSEVLGPLTVGEGYQRNGDVPVVPCDDAAVDRARYALRALLGEHLADDEEVAILVHTVFSAARAEKVPVDA